jgi:hypothetical protein
MHGMLRIYRKCLKLPGRYGRGRVTLDRFLGQKVDKVAVDHQLCRVILVGLTDVMNEARQPSAGCGWTHLKIRVSWGRRGAAEVEVRNDVDMS